MQRLVQPVPEGDELWDLLKSAVLVRLDDVLGGLGAGRQEKWEIFI